MGYLLILDCAYVIHVPAYYSTPFFIKSKMLSPGDLPLLFGKFAAHWLVKYTMTE